MVLLAIIQLHWEVNPHHFLVALTSVSLFSISSLITIGATCFVSVAVSSVTAPPSLCLVDYAVCLWLWACVPVQLSPSLSPCNCVRSFRKNPTMRKMDPFLPWGWRCVPCVLCYICSFSPQLCMNFLVKLLLCWIVIKSVREIEIIRRPPDDLWGRNHCTEEVSSNFNVLNGVIYLF